MIVKGLADRQPDLDEEVVGPPVSRGVRARRLADQGRAGLRREERRRARSRSRRRKSPARRASTSSRSATSSGSETRALLPDAARASSRPAIPWPKSMRWGWSETAFVRPVQWLVALFGGEVVPLDVGRARPRAARAAAIASCRPGWIEIASAGQVRRGAARRARRRRSRARRKTSCAPSSRGSRPRPALRVRPDEALLDEVINLGEYPVGVSGSFDPSFLEVPEEIIVTAMRNAPALLRDGGRRRQARATASRR